MRRDMEFNGYLELLGLRGGKNHSTHTISNAHLYIKDLEHKINNLQVPMYEGKKMIVRAWLHQL